MSSKDDYEVIEIGEDGSFDIPTTTSVKQQIIEEIDYHSEEWQRKLTRQENVELLQALQPSEFAIYHNKEHYWGAVRLRSSEEKVVEFLAQEQGNGFALKTKSGGYLSIPLDPQLSVNRSSIQAKVWKDFLTFSFTVRC